MRLDWRYWLFWISIFLLATGLSLYARDIVGAQETEARCAEDVNGDTYIDIIGDVASVNNWAYQSVPPAPDEYDLTGDGYVDIIGDLTRITNYIFRGQCFGMTATEYVDPGDGIMGVVECEHLGYAWYLNKNEAYAILGGFRIEGSEEPAYWWGKTICHWGGPQLYSTFCWFGVWSYVEGQGWMLRAITQQNPASMGLICGDNGMTEQFQIPLGQPFRYGMEHCIYNDGALVHGCHYHINEQYWIIY